MTMRIHFLGAAGEMTGSCHLLQVGNHRLLLDDRLDHGDRKEESDR